MTPEAEAANRRIKMNLLLPLGVFVLMALAYIGWQLNRLVNAVDDGVEQLKDPATKEAEHVAAFRGRQNLSRDLTERARQFLESSGKTLPPDITGPELVAIAIKAGWTPQ
jgi:hypothetical protein